jgi:hypothetical protein
MSQVIVQAPPNLAAPLSRATQSSRVSIALASEYGRYGYRRITVKLREAGWQVAMDRVQRIWRREGLRVPQKQRPRGRLWFNDGSCVRLRPEHANHVWSYDFVSAMTHDGRTLRLLVLLDEYAGIPGDPRGETAGKQRGDRDAGGCDAVAGDSGKRSFRQRPGVRGQGVAEVASQRRNGDTVYRTRQPLGERVLREFQWEAAG